MARPSKLTPAQWADIERRLASNESASSLAREFGINPSQITRQVTQVSQKVQEVAKQIAKSQTALEELPPPQQYNALRLADKLRSISDSLASAAELGARTGHRLQALANAEVGKVDDSDPLSEESIAALKGVGVLTRLANDSSHIALNLLAANKDSVKQASDKEREESDRVASLRPQISREQWIKEHGL